MPRRKADILGALRWIVTCTNLETRGRRATALAIAVLGRSCFEAGMDLQLVAEAAGVRTSTLYAHLDEIGSSFGFIDPDKPARRDKEKAAPDDFWQERPREVSPEPGEDCEKVT